MPAAAAAAVVKKEEPAGVKAELKNGDDEGGKELGEEEGELKKKPAVVAKKSAALDKDLAEINKLPVNERPKARRELRKKRHEQLLAEQTKSCQ